MLAHEHQVEGEVALDLLVDVPRRQARQHADQAGQEHQAQADAVEARKYWMLNENARTPRDSRSRPRATLSSP